jgi:glycosyltransferase involved in cell wall biosynthesis
MGCGDRVIAISETVKDYILENYPKTDPGKIRLIHRGVDLEQFYAGLRPPQDWVSAFYTNQRHIGNRPILLMPGRLSRWKGQLAFIELVANLLERGQPCHGLIVGEPDVGKEHYAEELRREVTARGLANDVTFLGHREDMAYLYCLASAVFNLSTKPEPFGRTVIEALATGTPVIAWDEGGPSESIRTCFPDGLVTKNDSHALVRATCEALVDRPQIVLPECFSLKAQVEATLETYRLALSEGIHRPRSTA